MKGMVTSPHHLASEAGVKIIRAGGTAIAVGSVLTRLPQTPPPGGSSDPLNDAIFMFC